MPYTQTVKSVVIFTKQKFAPRLPAGELGVIFQEVYMNLKLLFGIPAILVLGFVIYTSKNYQWLIIAIPLAMMMTGFKKMLRGENKKEYSRDFDEELLRRQQKENVSITIEKTKSERKDYLIDSDS